jgi:hypothetical protein
VSNCQPLTIKELEDLGSQLTQKQQQHEREAPVRSIETRNLQKLENTDPDQEPSCSSRIGVSAVLYPYHRVLQERRRQARQTTLLPFLKKKSKEPPIDPKTTEYDLLDPENPQPGHSSRQ